MNDAPRTDTTTNSDKIPPPALALDRYRHHLRNEDITEEQVEELLATLWGIMASFVDLGFDVRTIPSQFALPADKLAAGSLGMVGSSDPDKI